MESRAHPLFAVSIPVIPVIPVIPAQAGTQTPAQDSRLRGNDDSTFSLRLRVSQLRLVPRGT